MTSPSLNRPVDVLSVLDAFARRTARNCEACVDPIACTSCDLAKPLTEARAAVAELIEACRAYVGPMDDPRIGWCGHLPSNNDVFRCERCDEENLDSSFIEHKPGCGAVRLLAAIAAVEGKA